MLSRGVCRNFCLLHSSQPDGPLPASLPPRAGLPAAHKATGSPGPSAFLERGLLPCPPSAGLGGSRSLDVSTSPPRRPPPSPGPPPVDSGPRLKCSGRGMTWVGDTALWACCSFRLHLGMPGVYCGEASARRTLPPAEELRWDRPCPAPSPPARCY